MSRRRPEGDETWSRLIQWTKGQKAAERLSAHILRVAGYSSVDPSHPLGGRDSLKDIVCIKDGERWIGASYFPRGQKRFTEITKKFRDDLKGVKANNAIGIAFITNQELRESERKKLTAIADKSHTKLDLFYLELIAQTLDTPACYGLRLEFLDIYMNKEEQVAFVSARDAIIERLQSQLERILLKLENPEVLTKIPIEEIREFKMILDSVAGYDPLSGMYSGFSFMGNRSAHIRDLKVPLQELREFEQILTRLVRYEGYALGFTNASMLGNRHVVVQDLKVPLDEIREYEETLNRIIGKLKEARRLQFDPNSR